MQVGLFIPCYVDQLYPDVGIATVEVLERFGTEVLTAGDMSCLMHLGGLLRRQKVHASHARRAGFGRQDNRLVQPQPIDWPT